MREWEKNETTLRSRYTANLLTHFLNVCIPFEMWFFALTLVPPYFQIFSFGFEILSSFTAHTPHDAMVFSCFGFLLLFDENFFLFISFIHFLSLPIKEKQQQASKPQSWRRRWVENEREEKSKTTTTRLNTIQQKRSVSGSVFFMNLLTF